jgi:hypothetical protein
MSDQPLDDQPLGQAAPLLAAVEASEDPYHVDDPAVPEGYVQEDYDPPEGAGVQGGDSG